MSELQPKDYQAEKPATPAQSALGCLLMAFWIALVVWVAWQAVWWISGGVALERRVEALEQRVEQLEVTRQSSIGG